jgi:pilus assembly protein CpaB
MSSDRKWWRQMLHLDAVLLVVAILAGIAGAVLSERLLATKAAATEASLRSRYETRAVVVAAADLPPGESLDATRLAVRSMPKEFVPEDAVPADRAADLIGGQTAIRIRRGTPVVLAALRSGNQPQRLSTVLTGQQRALTIAVDDVNSQAGNLRPGDWVDLYYSRGSGAEMALVPLLQRVELLAAGTALRAADGNPDPMTAEQGYNTITLGLSGDDAARVLLAQQSGNLSVVLRPPTDSSNIPAEPRNSRELMLRPSRPRGTPADTRIELLVGGGGGLTPERTWLAIGQGRLMTAGDAS